MSTFIYFKSQFNLIVIRLLQHSAFRLQSEFKRQFAVVIKLEVIVLLICCLPKTFSVLGTGRCHLLFSRKKCPLTQKLSY